MSTAGSTQNDCGDALSPSPKQTLLPLLEASFEQFRANPAIETAQQTISYGELADMSAAVAARLQQHLSSEQLKASPVAIVLPRSIELYLAQVAVIRAGGFFVTIDPALPSSRINWMLEDSRTQLLVTSSQCPRLETDITQVDLSDQSSAAAQYKSPDSADKNDLAYLIYTSGSTGTPKAVAISNKAIHNHNRWCVDGYQKSPSDRCLQFTASGFDVCIEEVFSTFTSGGCLVPLEQDALQSPDEFHRWVQRRKLTVLTLPVSFWEVLVCVKGSHVWPASLRLVVFGGESVSQASVDLWFRIMEQRATAVDLVNAYGPSETTITASYKLLEKDSATTIGTPITGLSFFVVDPDGNLVECGTPGELYIGGAGVAEGYWNRSDLSKERFIECDFFDNGRCYRTGDRVRRDADGDYEFLGRLDEQVKIRGYRVEPSEIANVIQAQSGILNWVGHPWHA